MKRLQLFEFEDFPWFPDSLRQCMTLYIAALHRLMGTPGMIKPLLQRALQSTHHKQIVDLCSGGGGPMPEIAKALREDPELQNLEVNLTDLYPNLAAAQEFHKDTRNGISYRLKSVDATNVPSNLMGVRTMVCSLHHMRPHQVEGILKDASAKKQPFLAFEISDNSTPKLIWWVAIPFAFISIFFITPFVRPLTFRQVFFTYVIPILPLIIAWDGAASNARTYTKDDLNEILGKVKSDPSQYVWEQGSLKKAGTPGTMLYLLGLPKV